MKTSNCDSFVLLEIENRIRATYRENAESRKEWQLFKALWKETRYHLHKKSTGWNQA